MDVLAEHLLRFPSVDRLRAPVPVGDVPADVGDHDDVAGLVDQRRLLLDPRLCRLQTRDVGEHRDGALEDPVGDDRTASDEFV